jgi:hypothetical protein
MNCRHAFIGMAHAVIDRYLIATPARYGFKRAA